MTRLHHIPPSRLSEATAQTPIMRRFAAISATTVGAQGLFMGQTHLGPGQRSGAHHHGPSETAIYVVRGTPVFHYREGTALARIATRPGDYVYVPPHVPHVEENPGPEEAVLVLARTTQEAIVVNLDAL
jgi:uncharacterized RmlC-like cupin family protein